MSAIVQTCVVGSQPGSFDGMLKAIKFVVFSGGGLALDALTACRNVQPAPHVDPSVSAVDITVNVIAGVGVGVGVTSGGSGLLSSEATSDRGAILFWPNPTSTKEMPVMRNTRARRMRGRRNADCEVGFFFMCSGGATTKRELLLRKSVRICLVRQRRILM